MISWAVEKCRKVPFSSLHCNFTCFIPTWRPKNNVFAEQTKLVVFWECLKRETSKGIHQKSQAKVYTILKSVKKDTWRNVSTKRVLLRTIIKLPAPLSNSQTAFFLWVSCTSISLYYNKLYWLAHGMVDDGTPRTLEWLTKPRENLS